jgi:hypothetical protein
LSASTPPNCSDLEIRYEARPEHFGWLLCAFGSLGLPDATGLSWEKLSS